MRKINKKSSANSGSVMGLRSALIIYYRQELLGIKMFLNIINHLLIHAILVLLALIFKSLTLSEFRFLNLVKK